MRLLFMFTIQLLPALIMAADGSYSSLRTKSSYNLRTSPRSGRVIRHTQPNQVLEVAYCSKGWCRLAEKHNGQPLYVHRKVFGSTQLPSQESYKQKILNSSVSSQSTTQAPSSSMNTAFPTQSPVNSPGNVRNHPQVEALKEDLTTQEREPVANASTSVLKTRSLGNYNVRKGQGLNHARIAGVKKGDTIEVLSCKDDWCRIKSKSSDKVAYVHKRAISKEIRTQASANSDVANQQAELLEPTKENAAHEQGTPEQEIATSSLNTRSLGNYNVRKGQGINYKRIASLRKGDSVEVLACNENWCRIKGLKSGKIAYVHKGAIPKSIRSKAPQLEKDPKTKNPGDEEQLDVSSDKGKTRSSGCAKDVFVKRPLKKLRTTSPYGMRRHPILKVKKMHYGIDYGASTGTPIYASFPGKILCKTRGGYGKTVDLKHKGGVISTRNAHLSRYAKNCGKSVKRGEVIGYIGSTGRSTGPHLHFEVRCHGKPKNPIYYIDKSSGSSSQSNKNNKQSR